MTIVRRLIKAANLRTNNKIIKAISALTLTFSVSVLPATAAQWRVIEDFSSVNLKNSVLVNTVSRSVRIDTRRGELVMKPGNFPSFHDGIRFDFTTSKVARSIKGMRIEFSTRRCNNIDSGNAIMQMEAIGMGNMVKPRGHIRNIYGLVDFGSSTIGGSVYNYYPGRSNGKVETQHTQAMDRPIIARGRNFLEVRWTNNSYFVTGSRAGATTHRLPLRAKTAMTTRLARAARIEVKTFFSNEVPATCELRISKVWGYYL